MPFSFPITPTIPLDVNAGTRIVSAWGNSVAQFAEDSWADLQAAGNAVLDWPANVNAQTHRLDGVLALSFSGQAGVGMSGHGSEKALSLFPGLIISSAGNPGNPLSVYNNGFIFVVDSKGKVTTTGVAISSTVGDGDFIACYRQEDGIFPFIVTRAGNLDIKGIFTCAGDISCAANIAASAYYGGQFYIGGQLVLDSAKTFVGSGGVNSAGAAVFHGGVYVRSASEQNAAYMQGDGTIVGVNYYAAAAVGAAGPIVINAAAQFVGPGGVNTTGGVTAAAWVSSKGTIGTTNAGGTAQATLFSDGLIRGRTFQILRASDEALVASIDAAGTISTSSAGGIVSKGNILAQGAGIYVQDAGGTANIAYIAANGTLDCAQITSHGQVIAYGTVTALSPGGGFNTDQPYKVNGAPGVGGSFTTADGKTVSVSGGIITAIT